MGFVLEKQSSKGTVGGFLQLFDWNAKSRKKLFSSKSDLPEISKQKKLLEGNLPMTRLVQMVDEDEVEVEVEVGSSIIDYRGRASSVTDDDMYRTRLPGVVARLMGLDSFPTSNSLTSLDSRSLPGSCYHHQDPQIDIEPKHHKVINRRPIEKFQTEILAQSSKKGKMPPPCLKEQKASSRLPKRRLSSESSVVRLKECSSVKGTSISLALQAKTSIQKRRQKLDVTSEMSQQQQSMMAHKKTELNINKPCTRKKKGSSVLCQNNQKQNSQVSSSGGKDVLSLPTGSGRITRKKRSQDKNGKVVQLDQDHSKKSDVISFTFTAPITSASKKGHSNSNGGNLNHLLEQKLKELSNMVQQKSADSSYNEILFRCHEGEVIISDETKSVDCWFPSPVSVLDHSSSSSSSSLRETCISSDTGGDKQYCSSLGNWKVEYVKEIVCKQYNMEQMFKDYYVHGKASQMINPGPTPRRLLFDCVSECLDVRCKQYVGGGYELWAKVMWILKRKDRLVDDVYKDILGWGCMGDFMVDQLVDSDMSSQYGRWLDYHVHVFELGIQVQSCILDSLIDELVAHILLL